MHEETTLTGSSLQLFRQGKPYSFADESIGREWTINPFSFILKSKKDGGKGEPGIQLDWEHESYQWFDPDQINGSDDFEGVPRILESFRRVWFNIDLGEDAGKILGDGLMALQRDHESGARQLASKALDIFIDILQALDVSSRDVWWKNVRFSGWHLWKNGRESMGAPILNVVLNCLTIIEQRLPDGPLPKDFVTNIVSELQRYAQQRKEAGSRISSSLSTFLKEQFPGVDKIRVLTLSSSSTVASCIMQALEKGDPPLDLRILESRPLFEGVKMAEAIMSFAKDKDIRAEISLYTDASAGVAAKGIDIMIIGADLIDKSGNVSNKTGSLPAVLSAKHISPDVQVIALSEEEKVLALEPPTQEENDPQEVTQAWGPSVPTSNTGSRDDIKVKNVYFEWVPAAFIDHYVTEDGVTGEEEVAKWAHDAHRKADQFFSGL